MKWLRTMQAGLGLFAVALSLSLCMGSARALSPEDFTVQSFTADYYLDRSDSKVSTMRVEETIVAAFPQYDQNHGILRAIPETYKDMSLDVQIKNVSSNAAGASSYTTSHQNGNLVLKIGDANRYVRGVQTYRISYTLKNVVSFQDDHDELYWDVNGDQWNQPFGSVMARVHVTGAIAKQLQERQQCYSGGYGTRGRNCTIERTESDDETVLSIHSSGLSAKSTLTFALAFDKGTFAVDQAAILRQRLLWAMAAAFAVGLPLMIFGIMYGKWRAVGKDAPGKGVIIPQYIPPKDMHVLDSDVLLHENLRNQAITALLIELAIKGYVALYETTAEKGLLRRKSTSYEIELLKVAVDVSDAEHAVLRMFFENAAEVGSRVSLSNLKNKLYSQVADLGKSTTANLFTRGYFRTDPAKIRTRYYIWGGVMLGALALAGGSFKILGIVGIGMMIGLGISGLIVLLFARIMPARTAQGVEARDYLLGLREYIQLAEADRLKYLQSPEGVRQYGAPHDPKAKIKLFEKLLPYAMIFGLEKDWAHQFKDIYTQPPDWYHGSWSSFNAGVLVASLGGFNTASATSFTAPSSSNSSGFGGGGFSGGGGGGGGGGGW